MEAAYQSTENALFYNIPQSSYPRSSVAGYPTDNTTVPNDSLVRLNGSGQKVGPSIILKVMSGDVVDIAVHLFSKEIAYQKLDYIHYNPCAEYWQLAKEPADYLFSSAKYYETGVNDFAFLKDLRNEF